MGSISLEFSVVQKHSCVVVVNTKDYVYNIPLIKFQKKYLNDVGLWKCKI